jgi:UDP-N-acetyl-D-mannosaminuronic acid dehydrogenase
MEYHNPNVLVIGLGQIGFSDAEYMTSRGINVDGYDIDQKAVMRAFNHRVIQRQAQTFEGYDYYVICISTHKPENMLLPSLDGLFQIACKLSHEGKKGSLVCIESTITRGVSNRVNQIIRHKMHVVHVPHRFFAKEKEAHGVRQMRVLGGCESCCTKKALHFYRDLLNIPMHIVKPVEIAELSKIVENSHRFMEIAFAEELKMLCEAYDLDFNELRAAINTKWNVKILAAEQGIGGHCLPKDAQMYLDLSAQILKPSIIDSAKAVDNQYKKTVSRKPVLSIIVPATIDVSST